MTPEKALEEAARIVGGKAELARALGITVQALSQWKVCPPTRVLAVEAEVRRAKARLRNAPTKHDLRPDIYPKKGVNFST